MNICAPCEHGVCPGLLLKIICVCKEYRHEACEVCVETSKEKGSGICCMGCVPMAPTSGPFLRIPMEEIEEEGDASKDFENKFERFIAGNVMNDSEECSVVDVQSIVEYLDGKVFSEEMDITKTESSGGKIGAISKQRIVTRDRSQKSGSGRHR